MSEGEVEIVEILEKIKDVKGPLALGNPDSAGWVRDLAPNSDESDRIKVESAFETKLMGGLLKSPAAAGASAELVIRKLVDEFLWSEKVARDVGMSFVEVLGVPAS